MSGTPRQELGNAVIKEQTVEQDSQFNRLSVSFQPV
ncbi:hypothetical protein PM8797T_03099 [Gimesia maris DSM 8797]|nr:hypothetical protein PM8797T_03099 [Gimesia maris DSM 8797]